jgi:hypothetical protein
MTLIDMVKEMLTLAGQLMTVADIQRAANLSLALQTVSEGIPEETVDAAIASAEVS